MFLLNPFTNDARVQREALALVQAGFHITVIALTEPGNNTLPLHEWRDGVEIYRVSREGAVTRSLKRVLALGKELLGGHSRSDSDTSPSASVPSRASPSSRPRRTLRFARRIGILWRMAMLAFRLNATSYHAHDLNTMPAAVLAKILRPRPLIYDSHEAATGRVGHDVWYMHALERASIPFSNAVIATTETRAQFMTDKYGIVPAVIGNVVDLTITDVPPRDLHHELQVPEDEPLVVYQGGVQAGRGIEQVLQSIPLWRTGTFLVVGDGALLETVTHMARTLGVADRVRFTGRVPLSELLGYTKAARLGLQVLQNTCFNHYSTDSNKLFEYFAAGLPVVAADYPEIRKVVAGFDAGMLVDPHDPKQIASAVNQLLLDSQLWTAKAENARRVPEHYNWQSESLKLLALYRNLLGERCEE